MRSKASIFAGAVAATLVAGHAHGAAITQAELMRFYPPNALERRVEGRATVACAVARDGALRRCRVVRETPSGWGFGEAALKVADRARLKSHRHDRFTLQLVFRLPAAQRS